MNTRIIFMAMAGILLSAIVVYGQIDVQVTVISGVEPKIRAVFNESVILRNATIFKLAEGRIPLVTSSIPATKSPPTGMVATYVLTPTRALSNGNYLIQLIATDLVGNELLFTEPFVVAFPETEIRVIDPPLGATSRTSFDLTIQTIREDIPRLSTCKFSSFDPKENLQAAGLQSFTTPAPGTPSAVHTIKDFPQKLNLLPNVPTPNFFVICTDDLKRVVQQQISAMIDTISPVIQSVTLDPYRIIELPEGGGPFTTTATVQASELVICRFSIDESKPFEQMDPFDDFDEQDITAFKTTATQEIALPEEDKKTHTIFVQCRDRAGQVSPEFSRQIQVDLSAAIGINVLSPAPLSLGEALNLTFTTDKSAACEFKNIDGTTVEITNIANPKKTHAAPLGDLNEGSYTVTISCQSGQAGMFQEQTIDYGFSVDKTPPTTPRVNGSMVSCTSNPLSFAPSLTFTATDALSGVREFRYAIPALGINTTTTGSIAKLSHQGAVNATNASAQLAMTVVAVNQVGLIGAPATVTIGVNAKHVLCLEKNPPHVTISEEKKTAEVQVTLSCTDDTACDTATFLYGTADNQTACKPFTAYVAPFSVFRTQAVCYSVKDTAGNNASGSKIIKVNAADTCANGVKDGDETDIDCGGSCGSTCLDNKVCSKDADCYNFFCSNGICATPTCTDGIKNNKESDIDCGGPNCREACENDKACARNEDCTSGFCDPETKTCATSTCTDGKKGGNESDVDCGGDCPKCETNQQCYLPSDCATDNCVYGMCEEKAAPAPPIPPSIAERTFMQRLGGFIASWWLILLGTACILGGSGYLYYKKHLPLPAVPPSITPRGITPPLTKEEIERRKVEEERKKRLAETVKQRLEREEQLKREKRTKLFKPFGGKEKTPEEKAEMPPEGGVETEAGAAGEWLPLEKLREKIKDLGIEEEEEKKKEKKQKPAIEEEFESLGKLAGEGKPEEDVFAKLPTEEQPRQPEEDVFARLPKEEETETGKGEEREGKEEKEGIDRDLLRRIKEKEEKKGVGRMPGKKALGKQIKANRSKRK